MQLRGNLHTVADEILIISDYLTYRARRIARRTWRERLFSWPWRPLASRKVVVVDALSRIYHVARDSDGRTNIVCTSVGYSRMLSRMQQELR